MHAALTAAPHKTRRSYFPCNDNDDEQLTASWMLFCCAVVAEWLVGRR